ncbi:peptide ABC transporter substrate-binding protein, partial [Parageobacillus sp. SY1]
ILFSLMLVLSLFLSACGGFQKGNESTGEKGKSGDKTADVPQELRINIKTEPFSLNPSLANDSVSSNVLNQTFEGLTRIKNGKPELAMAESYEVSKDLKTYTFKLRDAK